MQTTIKVGALSHQTISVLNTLSRKLCGSYHFRWNFFYGMWNFSFWRKSGILRVQLAETNSSSLAGSK